MAVLNGIFLEACIHLDVPPHRPARREPVREIHALHPLPCLYRRRSLIAAFRVIEPHFAYPAAEKMVDVVVTVPVPRFEMQIDQIQIILRGQRLQASAPVLHDGAGHFLHDPPDLLPPDRGMGTAYAVLVGLEVAAEHLQALPNGVLASHRIGRGGDPREPAKVKLHGCPFCAGNKAHGAKRRRRILHPFSLLLFGVAVAVGILRYTSVYAGIRPYC